MTTTYPPANSTSTGPSKLEDFLRRNKETISFVSVLVGVSGFIFGVWCWVHSVRVENAKDSMERKAASDRQVAEEKRRSLEEENTKLATSNNVISALDIVSRYAQLLPGNAMVGEKDGGRISSSMAVQRFAPKFDGSVTRFEPNFAAIEALKALTDILVAKKNEDERLDFVASYIAPVLFAQCQSDDPTVAAGALATCGHVLNDSGLMAKVEGGNAASKPTDQIFSQLPTVFHGRQFDKVDFKNLITNLDHFSLDAATFNEAKFAPGSSFAGSSLSGAKMQSAFFNRANFRQAHVDKKNPANFNHSNFDQCENFEGSELAGCIFDSSVFIDSVIGSANLEGASFQSIQDHFDNSDKGKSKVRFVSSHLEEAHFENATLTQPIFEKCWLTGSHFETARLDGAKFIGGFATNAVFSPSSAESAVFIGTDLRGADFGSCSLSEKAFTGGVSLDWARIGASSKDFLNAIDGSSMDGFKIDEGGAIIVVSPAPPTPAGPKYLYAGVIKVSSGRLHYDPTTSPAVLFADLRALPEKVAGQIGLDHHHVFRDASNDEIASELLKAWHLKCTK